MSRVSYWEEGEELQRGLENIFFSLSYKKKSLTLTHTRQEVLLERNLLQPCIGPKLLTTYHWKNS